MGGSSQETESKQVAEPPKWFNDAAIKSLEVADKINQAGFVPYLGNTTAGFTPMQQAAMQSASDWNSAANGTAPVNAMAGVPQASRDASGVMGYASSDGMMANLQKLRAQFPAQYKLLTQFGGDLLADPSKPPGQIKDSPWSVGATAKQAMRPAKGTNQSFEDRKAWAQNQAAADYANGVKNIVMPWPNYMGQASYNTNRQGGK
jgi:hypothetical protein